MHIDFSHCVPINIGALAIAITVFSKYTEEPLL